MDDATAKELGLRALAAGFRWAPGVKLGSADETYRLTLAWYGEDEGDGATPIMHPAGDGIGPGWGWPADGSGWWPDLRDPATLGVLLAQVRDRSGALLSPVATVGLDISTGWTLDHPESPMVDALDIGHHATEAHALVAALEAAR
jgi:hypothetical protein